MPPLLALRLLLAVSTLYALTPVLGFSFSLPASPAQCETLPLNITGGSNPYQFTFLQFPSSASPNASNTSLWTAAGGRVYSLTLNLPTPLTESTSAIESVILPFAGDSRMVVVGSDGTGYGTGGTSAIIPITNSSDNTCLLSTFVNETAAQEAFRSYPSQVEQCVTSDVLFSAALPGPITVDTIVPMGQSYRVETNNTASSPDLEGMYISLVWEVDVTAGTEVAFVLGDSGGVPVLVSQVMTVGQGTYSCDSLGAFSSAYPSPTGATTSSSGSKAGPIAGGVVGGVFGTLIVAATTLFLLRMWNKKKRRAAQQMIGLSVWRHSAPEKLERASWGKGYRDDPEEEGV